MEIQRFVVGQLQTNCYFLICSETQKAVIIDPGDDADFLSDKILQLKIQPQMILLTHCHFDHVLSAAELSLNYKIPVLLHQKDEFLLKEASRSAAYWLGEAFDHKNFFLPSQIKFLKKDQIIQFGQEKLKVIPTPGHTPGSLSFYHPKQKVLFDGDLIFQEGVGRTDFNYSSETDLQKSIQKILKLPSATLAYPGHGPEFYLKNI